jgi:hypothetical protein
MQEPGLVMRPQHLPHHVIVVAQVMPPLKVQKEEGDGQVGQVVDHCVACKAIEQRMGVHHMLHIVHEAAGQVWL